ncbi:MAG: MFS transporter [Planctomycetes bacterium]|nr:MFS transporter [Planctomycetota bacterium]
MSDTKLTSTGLMPDGSQQLDINGRPITPRMRRRGMNINILCCGLGTLFAVAFWPSNALFSMYMTERLGASDLQVGFFAAIIGIGQMFQLIGVYIFDRTKTRKVLWVAVVLTYRVLSFSVVGFAVYAHTQGSSLTLVWAMLAVMAVGFSLAQMTANAWWSWMADLAPESTRGQFFANRQLAATVASLIGTLPVILLDKIGTDAQGNYTNEADYIFISIFALCTLSGITDIIIHAFIPEPARLDRPDSLTLGDTVRNLIQPLLDKRFRQFTIAMTFGAFAVMFWSPFVWPYLKDKNTIDIAYSANLITTALAGLGMMIGSRYWGVLIDRFGAKPIMAITYSAGLLSVYLLFITPANATLLVYLVGGLMGGFMWSGMNLAVPQLMLTLSPTKTRNSYVATHGVITGLAILVGPLLAGYVADHVRSYLDGLDFWYVLPGGTRMTHMQVLVIVGLVARMLVYPLILRIREGNEKPMGVVLSTVLGPTQFRTLYAMRVFAGRNVGKKVEAMRRMGAGSDQLAVSDLIDHLDDAEPEIRQEATLALGRIGGPEAIEALVRQLTSPESDVHSEAARALSMTGDPAVIGPLEENLAHPNEGVRLRVAKALEDLPHIQTAQPLLEMIRKDEFSVSDLVNMLEHLEPEVRQEAVLALGRAGGPQAVQILMGYLKDPQCGFRAEAAKALGMTKDPQAVTLLVERLSDPDEAVRERVAEALGELKTTEAAKPLMNLLRSDESPNVFGRGASALARLGVMDAIWEILPKMHQTTNVALRRQLATAVGNLIGRPAEFYHLMNDEFRSPGEQTFKLTRQTRKDLERLARRMGAGPEAAQAEQLRVAARHVGVAAEQFELQEYEKTLEQLHTAAMEMLRSLYGFAAAEETAVEYALSRNGRFGVGLWFLRVARNYALTAEGKDELLRLDALLGFHFLGSFTETLVP